MIRSTAYLLQRNGYVGTSINDIIEHSGSPRGSLYYHFPNGKEQLALEAVLWTKENVTAFITESLAKYDDAAQSIEAFLIDSGKRFEENNYFNGVPITALVLETAATSDKLRSACQEVFDAWSSAFADKLIANGYSKNEAKVLGETINAMIQGGFVLSLARQDGNVLKIMASNISQIIPSKSHL